MTASPAPQAGSPAAPSAVPLLQGQGLPPFEAISAEQVDQGIPLLLAELHAELDQLEADLSARATTAEPLSWPAVMEPLHHLGERLRWSWGVVSHLNGVCNSPELRDAHQRQQAAVVSFGNRAGQSRPIYGALRQLWQQHQASAEGQPGHLDPTQQRIVQAELRDMEFRGVGLAGAEQQAFNATSQQLAELATTYSNHVLDATNGWTLRLSDPAELAGLPASLRELLAQAAGDGASADHGPWLMGLDMPRVVPFLKYSARRDLRETVYRAQVARAASGELDNSPLIEQILALKLQQARRLGYANWAEVSLASKMAGSVAEVEQLLEELRAAAYPVAQQELEALRACAARHGAPEAADLKPWDVSFWAEKLRQQSFDLDSEALRPWFPLEQVLQGLFALCQRLFDIRIVASEPGEAPSWHPDVRYFKVLDGASGAPLAAFYLDPFSRPGSKHGGA